MQQEKALLLLNRQLTDLQAQADNILRGEYSSEAIEAFARYSFELKKFITEKINDAELNALVNEIPDVNYKRTQIKLWQYLILASWWFNLYKDYQARKKSLEEVTLVRGKFSSLQLIVKSKLN